MLIAGQTGLSICIATCGELDDFWCGKCRVTGFDEIALETGTGQESLNTTATSTVALGTG